MFSIRNNVFETNSSSSHSIVMTKANTATQNKIDPGWKIRDGILSFKYWSEDLEFGRAPFDILADWFGRLRYAIASYGENHIDDIREICQKHIIGFKDFNFPVNEYSDDEKEINYGYVDHQSSGLLQHFLDENNISLEDFIFNDKFIVIIDGDEYQVFNRMMEANIINKDFIEKEAGIYD